MCDLTMPTITLSIPQDIKSEMDEFKFINWSEVARTAIKGKLGQLRLFNQIVAKSQLTETDAQGLSQKINASMHQAYEKKRSAKTRR